MLINKTDHLALVDTFAAAGNVVDGIRLAGLTGLLQFRTSERAAADVEQKRLAAKYGNASTQATTAAARVSQLDMELEALIAEVIRQQSPAPATAPDRFIVYGRVLSSKGEGLAKVTVAAVDANKKALASAQSGDLGRFELTVPVATKAGAPTKDVAGGQNATAGTPDPTAQAAPITFQLNLTNQQTKLAYMFDEVFTAVGGQMAYREITAPDAPTAPPPVTKPVVTAPGVIAPVVTPPVVTPTVVTPTAAKAPRKKRT